MNAFYVVATNRHFWQTIGVRAATKEAAAEAFAAYLAEPAQRKAEADELADWLALGIDEAADLGDYRYAFDEDDIEECDEPDAPRVTEAVRMLDSGGNG